MELKAKCLLHRKQGFGGCFKGRGEGAEGGRKCQALRNELRHLSAMKFIQTFFFLGSKSSTVA